MQTGALRDAPLAQNEVQGGLWSKVEASLRSTEGEVRLVPCSAPPALCPSCTADWCQYFPLPQLDQTCLQTQFCCTASGALLPALQARRVDVQLEHSGMRLALPDGGRIDILKASWVGGVGLVSALHR